MKKLLLILVLSVFTGGDIWCTAYMPSPLEAGLTYLEAANDGASGHHRICKLKKKETFRSQVTKENTTYEIKYDFDLNGEAVTIPSGCTLKFSGGSLRNGTVVLDGTIITGKKTTGIFRAVNVKGTVKGDCHAKWFNEKDVLERLFAIVDKRIYLEEGETYSLSHRLVFPKSGMELHGNGAAIRYCGDGVKLSLNTLDDILIEKVVIDGSNRTNLGIACYRCHHFRLKDVTVRNISWDANTAKTYCYGVEMVACNDIHIDWCTVEDVKATATSNVAGGIAFNVSGSGETSKDITIEHCCVRRIWALDNGVGIGADCIVISGRYQEDKEANAIVRHCTFWDFTKRAIKAQAAKVTIDSCAFGFTSFMEDKQEPNFVISIFGSDSYVTNNKINLKNHKCMAGIGIHAAGKAYIKGKEVSFEQKEITQRVEICGNEIVSDYMSYGILIGIANRADANQYKNLIIRNNVIKGNYSLFYGIRTMDAVEDCVIEDNTITNASIGIWTNCLRKTVRVNGEEYPYSPKVKDIFIKNNEIRMLSNEGECGFKFDWAEGCTISNNIISNYKNGILLGGNEADWDIMHFDIDKNTFNGCSWGIETNKRCTDINITSNTFEGSKLYDMVIRSDKAGFHLNGNVTPKKIYMSNN